MRFGSFSYNQARPWAAEKQAFDELLEQILLTDQLGFDEAWFAEHHHSDYGMLASPNLIIATLRPHALCGRMRHAGHFDQRPFEHWPRSRCTQRRYQAPARPRYRSGSLRGRDRDLDACLDRRDFQLLG